MKTKIKIESIFGKLLFEHEAENNTIKKTLEEAVKSDANLSGANLGGANLRGANLRGAYLGGAYLSDAYLGGANLSGANLSGANLRGANLGGANLSGAYLGGAYLSDAYLGGANLGGEWGKLESVSDILIVGPIGSRNGYTTIYHTDKGIFVMCGCFRGTLDKFVKKVEDTHGDNKHARDYKALVEFAKVKFEL